MLAREPDKRPPVSNILSRPFLRKHIAAFATAALTTDATSAPKRGRAALRSQLLSAGLEKLEVEAEEKEEEGEVGEEE
ncbi:hypothetical protein T492DRAFT_859094 [Pavlovales sp. CCMP2436]|nr:hypothetical protein T492DRAFT_859094 [Pavlovales sp. CCMP2436]